MKQYLIKIISAIVLSTSLSVHAADRNRNANFFLTLGRTFLEVDGDKDETSALKIGGGYRFSSYAGFEIFYINYGRISERIDVGNSATFNSHAFILNGIAMFPVHPLFDLYAKVGISEWKWEVNFPSIGSASKDGTDPVYTVGFGYNIDHDSTVRFEYERSEYDEIDYSVISFGFQHNF